MFEVSWRVKRDRSTEIMERTKDRIELRLEAGANRILATALELVHRRTGETAATGRVEKLGRMDYRVVFGGAAIYLEFGTSHHPAYPFLIPAAEDQRQQIFLDVAHTINGRIKGSYIGHSTGVQEL